jgi:hypothetical protein
MLRVSEMDNNKDESSYFSQEELNVGHEEGEPEEADVKLLESSYLE